MYAVQREAQFQFEWKGMLFQIKSQVFYDRRSNREDTTHYEYGV